MMNLTLVMYNWEDYLPLRTNSSTGASIMGSRAIGIKILVHFESHIVGGISYVDHVRSALRGDPTVSSSPWNSRNQDQLSCSRISNCIYGGLQDIKSHNIKNRKYKKIINLHLLGRLATKWQHFGH